MQSAVTSSNFWRWFVGYLPWNLIHRRDAKKCLELLRNPLLWSWEIYERNPWSTWGDLVYNLNRGGDLKDSYDKTYVWAKWIGSTPDELWDIHRHVFRWHIEGQLQASKNGQYVMKRNRGLPYHLKQANCTLEDFGITELEFALLQKKNCLEAVKEQIGKYLSTKDENFLFALRPDFENADVAQITVTDLEAIPEFKNLNYMDKSAIYFAAKGFLHGNASATPAN